MQKRGGGKHLGRRTHPKKRVGRNFPAVLGACHAEAFREDDAVAGNDRDRRARSFRRGELGLDHFFELGEIRRFRPGEDRKSANRDDKNRKINRINLKFVSRSIEFVEREIFCRKVLIVIFCACK